MRVFLDANILFSAAKSAGAVRQLLAIVAKRDYTLCVDAYVIEEARRNLVAKSPASVAYLDELLPTLDIVSIVAQEKGHADHGLPEKDRPVMAAAIRGRCNVLLTGDKTHFGHLYGRRTQGVEVLSPALFASRILEPGR